jgi:hypothetical protein
MEVMVASPAEQRRIEIPARHRGSGLAQWTLLLASILAAFGQQQLAYGLVRLACTREMPALVHVPTVLAVAVIAVTARLAWVARARSGTRAVGDERSSDARARFVATTALLLCGFSLLLVAAQWLPVLYIHPCSR